MKEPNELVENWMSSTFSKIEYINGTSLQLLTTVDVVAGTTLILPFPT